MEHCPSLHPSILSALWPPVLPVSKDLEEINSFNEKCKEHCLGLQPSVMSATAVPAAVRPAFSLVGTIWNYNRGSRDTDCFRFILVIYIFIDATCLLINYKLLKRFHSILSESEHKSYLTQVTEKRLTIASSHKGAESSHCW